MINKKDIHQINKKLVIGVLGCIYKVKIIITQLVSKKIRNQEVKSNYFIEYVEI